MSAVEPYTGPARTVMTTSSSGDEVTIPAPEVEEWQFEVAYLNTYLGLADWYLERQGVQE